MLVLLAQTTRLLHQPCRKRLLLLPWCILQHCCAFPQRWALPFAGQTAVCDAAHSSSEPPTHAWWCVLLRSLELNRQAEHQDVLLWAAQPCRVLHILASSAFPCKRDSTTQQRQPLMQQQLSQLPAGPWAASLLATRSTRSTRESTIFNFMKAKTALPEHRWELLLNSSSERGIQLPIW